MTRYLFCVSLFFLFIPELLSQKLPAGFYVIPVASGLNRPTSMVMAPDGRIFYAEQDGKLRVIKNGNLLPAPFVSLNVNSQGERGLIGVVLDPNFSSNQYVYLYYTVPGTPAHNRVSRFTASGDVAVAGSERILLELDPLSLYATNHNGGAMRFGKDGKLYVAIGDNANGNNAQNLDTHLGKLLRINPDGSVPSGNPFATGTEQKKRVWAYGLRNPFTFDVQPGTGKVFINDVGQSSWEEIDDASVAGRNFGWPIEEGTVLNSSYTNPILSYMHKWDNGNGGCAITGGTFFNPNSTNYPSQYVGQYFFLDLCSNWIHTLDLKNGNVRSVFASNISSQSVSLTTGTDGNLYFLSRVEEYNQNANSTLYKIVYSNPQAPVILLQPGGNTVSQGQSATFKVIASGAATLNYQWRKNGVDIPGATSESYTVSNAQASNAGQYTVRVSNSAGFVVSNSVPLTVNIFNNYPLAKITAPLNGSLFQAGETVTYAGAGTDPEDGTLPASAFDWTVVFYHDTHTHPGPYIDDQVKNGSFVIPDEGETSSNVWYRVFLTVTDSKGLKHTDSVTINLKKANLNFVTNPTGLKIIWDSQPKPSPFAVTAVAGMLINVGVPSPQVLNSVTYFFDRWDGPSISGGSLVIPSTNTTYTAVFKTFRSPDNPGSTTSGLEYKYFQGVWLSLPDYTTLPTLSSGNVANFDLAPRHKDDLFGFRYTGYVQVPADGVYTFYTNSDDGSRLYIGNTLVVDNDGAHNPLEKSGTIGLKAGKHAITVDYFERYNGEVLQVSYAGPGINKQLIPNAVLSRVSLDCLASGTLLREFWSEAQGALVSDIPLARTPNISNYLTLFESPSNVADNFGERLSGYLCVPITGNYTFQIAADNDAELWLSTDANPANKVRIAYVNGFASSREWTKYLSQTSVPIALQAKRQYYIEALHKDAWGGDNLAVGWTLPNGTQERPIPGNRLSPHVPGLAGRMAVEESITELQLQTYPNPFSEKLTVHFQLPQSGDALLEVYDGRGSRLERLFEGPAEAGKNYELEVNHLKASGMYVIRLSTPAGVAYRKVIRN
jgi:glucose/arabinose dehydrogenase